MRVAVQVAAAHANHRHLRLGGLKQGIGRRASTPVMWNFENRNRRQRSRQHRLGFAPDIAREQRARSNQNHRSVISIVPLERNLHRHHIDFALAGDLYGLRHPVLVAHPQGVDTQRTEHGKSAADVVCVSVGDHDSIEMSNPPPAEPSENAGRRRPSVNQQTFTGSELDQRRVALTHIEKGHPVHSGHLPQPQCTQQNRQQQCRSIRPQQGRDQERGPQGPDRRVKRLDSQRGQRREQQFERGSRGKRRQTGRPLGPPYREIRTGNHHRRHERHGHEVGERSQRRNLLKPPGRRRQRAQRRREGHRHASDRPRQRKGKVWRHPAQDPGHDAHNADDGPKRELHRRRAYRRGIDDHDRHRSDPEKRQRLGDPAREPRDRHPTQAPRSALGAHRTARRGGIRETGPSRRDPACARRIPNRPKNCSKPKEHPHRASHHERHDANVESRDGE